MEEDYYEDEPVYVIGCAIPLTENQQEDIIKNLHKVVFEVTGTFPQKQPKQKMGFY